MGIRAVQYSTRTSPEQALGPFLIHMQPSITLARNLPSAATAAAMPGHQSSSSSASSTHASTSKLGLKTATPSTSSVGAGAGAGAGAGDISLYDVFLSKLRDDPSTRWPAEKEATLVEPFTYLTATPGKDMRAQLIDAFNVWLNVPSESLVVVKQVVGQLHTASLLMDDVEDDSELRRGIPVAHKIYGIPQTINCANYVYFLAYQELTRLQSASNHTGANLLQIVNEELLNLHRGQGMDLYWRDSLTCPTEE